MATIKDEVEFLKQVQSNIDFNINDNVFELDDLFNERSEYSRAFLDAVKSENKKHWREKIKETNEKIMNLINISVSEKVEFGKDYIVHK